MVVCDFDAVCVAVLPFKADSPLVIDPDAVLPGTVPRKLLQTVRGRDPEIVQSYGSVEHTQLAQSSLLNIPWQLFRGLPRKNLLGLFASEASDHRGIV